MQEWRDLLPLWAWAFLGATVVLLVAAVLFWLRSQDGGPKAHWQYLWATIAFALVLL
jgi:hypothetical protein